MPRLLLSHLLGVLLLLSQLPGGSQGNGSEMIKLCGSDLVLFWIRLCGNLNWDRMALSQEQSRLGSGQPAEIMPSSIANDAETLNMVEFVPAAPQELTTAVSETKPTPKELPDALTDFGPRFKELMESILNKINGVEDRSPSEFKYIGSPKHFLKKRETLIVDKCCNFGCTKREMARFC